MSDVLHRHNPWFASFICVLFCVLISPAFAMFFLNRGWLGVMYLIAQVCLAILVPVTLNGDDALFNALSVLDTGTILMSVIAIAGIIHSLLIIWSGKYNAPLRWYATFTGLASILVLPLFIAIIIRSFLFQPFHIPSGSMQPTLQIGDYIFVRKYAYGYSKYSLPFNYPLFDGKLLAASPKRGDVVVFKKPSDVRIDYVKRIVGLPGDRVQMKDGKLYINRQPVSIMKNGAFRADGYGEAAQYTETLPNRVRYHILDYGARFSDNTREYMVPAGHYFVLGDNRDGSNDSRNPHDIGFIPESYILGPVSVIWWNSKSRRFLWKRTNLD